MSPVSMLRRQTLVPPAAMTAPRETPTVAVEHGECPEILRPRTEPGVVGHRHRLQIRAPMVVHHAFRASRRPGGVVDREQTPFVGIPPHRRTGVIERGLVVIEPVRGTADDDPDPDRRTHRPRAVGELDGRDQQGRTGMLEM